MGRFDGAYLESLRDYICELNEITLRRAYELGREAVRRELSVLDLAVAHHDALAAVLPMGDDADNHEQIVRAAGDFFLESISAFEMVQRGFREARDAAMLERRHAEMLRQLSHFLADASLALDESDSLDEMLRLVAEQARELIPADCCLVTTEEEDHPRVRAASFPQDELAWAAFVRWADLSHIGGAARSGQPVRIRGDDIATRLRVPGSTSSADLVLRDWLFIPLTALDGRMIGAIHLINERDGEFSGLHEAVAVHLAQMSAAAIERARSYSRRGDSHA
jgi:transcriptional regulator with GAF, ATPase, and Fis domain